jgi:ribosomal protein L40E
MASCPKCESVNLEGATRCRVCNAMIPIKLGSAAEHVYERSGIHPARVGLKCARCGAMNPYTRFKCQQCGVSLTQYRRPGLFDQAWTYLALGALLLVVMFVVFRGG